MPNSFSITNTSKTSVPRAVFHAIKETILGKGYSLTVSVVTPAAMKKMNLMYRNKNVPTDILSFPLSKKEGEIYLCLSEARKEAKKFGRSYDNFLLFLFIHGCVHLKGYDHGDTMEEQEIKIRRKFDV